MKFGVKKLDCLGYPTVKTDFNALPARDWQTGGHTRR